MSRGPSQFGGRVRALRVAVALTQAELAERSGISERTVSDLERGLRHSVYASTARQLAAALGIGADDLAEFLRTAGGASGSAASIGGATAGLPRPITPILGRRAELAAIRRLIRRHDVRLVTVLGPGGIGKTRLAVEVAHSAGAEFEAGRYFVDLSRFEDPSQVRPAIGIAFGVQPDSADLLMAIANRVSTGHSLLVLDTFEHLAPAASVVAELLAACPTLTVIVTSRAPLQLRGEQQVRLEPLRINGPEAPAVSLFLERAHAARPQLHIDAAGLQLVRDICSAIDAVPLAIELAAARVRHMSLSELASQLESPLGPLVGGTIDLPVRQQTMRGAIDWSCRLLAAEARTLLLTLSVFRGGCSRSDVDGIAGAPGSDALLDPLSALVDASLVIHETTASGESRFRMLDVTRKYASEQAAAAGELDGLRSRHARHFCMAAERAESESRGSDQRRWYEALLIDEPNFRAALAWAMGAGEGELALRMAGSLWMFWRWAGLYAEGRRWLEAALAAGSAAPLLVRLQGMWGAGWLAYHQAEYRRTTELGREMLHLLDSTPLETAADKRLWPRNALTLLGSAALADGDTVAAIAALEEAQRLGEEIGPGWHAATSLLNLGTALLYSGRAAEASDHFRRSIVAYESVGDQYFLARALIQLGYAALATSARGDAEAAITRAIQMVATSSAEWGLAEGLEAVATLRSSDHPRKAVILAGAAERIRERISMRPHPADRSINERHLRSAQGRMGEADYERARQAGRNLSPEDAISLALGYTGARTDPIVN